MFQHGQPHQNKTIPPKRKGNPVITRYAPPPGYQQPGYQTPFQQAQGSAAPQRTYNHPVQYGPYQAQPPLHQPHIPYQQPPNPYYQQAQYAQQPPQPQPQPQGSYGAGQFSNGPYQQPNYNHPPSAIGYQYQQQQHYQPGPNIQQTPQQLQTYHQHPLGPPPLRPASLDGQSPQSSQYSPHTNYPQYPVHGTANHGPKHHHPGHQNGQTGPYPNGGSRSMSSEYGHSPHTAPTYQSSAATPSYQGSRNSWDWHRQTYDDDMMGSNANKPPDTDQEAPPRRMPNVGALVYDPDDDHQFWDFENSMGALWPKAGDYVNPRTSIGVHTWRSARPVTRALPSSWEENEKLSEDEPAALGNGASVSSYFGPNNAYEALLDVRQTDLWKDVEHYPEFQDVGFLENVVSRQGALRKARQSEQKRESRTLEPAESGQDAWNVMDTLDKALDSSGSAGSAAPSREGVLSSERLSKASPSSRLPHKGSASHETLHPPASQNASNHSYPCSEAQRVNSNQEEILARLGVTGDPKPHMRGLGRHQQQNAAVPPPPPPPKNRSPSLDPWSPNGTRRNKRSMSIESKGSQHTIAGSDFSPQAGQNGKPNDHEMLEQSPNGHGSPGLARKRSRVEAPPYAASDFGRNGDAFDGGRQADDGGRRKRPKPNSRSTSNPYG